MAHNRTQIRDAVMTLLTPGVTSATVYSERRHRIDSTIRPLVIVSLGEDAQDIGQAAMGQPVYEIEHVQVVTCEIHVEAATGVECAVEIDQIELEVEQSLASDLTLGGICEIIYPIASELEMQTEQDRVIAVRSVNYSIPWRCAFGSPDIPET